MAPDTTSRMQLEGSQTRRRSTARLGETPRSVSLATSRTNSFNVVTSRVEDVAADAAEANELEQERHGIETIETPRGQKEYGEGLEKKQLKTEENCIIKTFNRILNSLTLMLENKGTVARDHLANERTFLAWVRTAIGFITVAVGVAQFYRLEMKSTSVTVNGTKEVIYEDSRHHLFKQLGLPVSSMCLVLSILTLLFGGFRYFHIQVSLTYNYFPATRILVLVLLIVSVSMVALLLALNIKMTI